MSEALVRVDDEEVARVDGGLMVLVGCAEGDTGQDARFMAEKIASLRIFEDEQGKMNLSVTDIGGEVLLVPNFTLLGDCRKGRRPSFTAAATPERAQQLFQDVVAFTAGAGLTVKSGIFAARMAVSLVNDGPVTLLLDSSRVF